MQDATQHNVYYRQTMYITMCVACTVEIHCIRNVHCEFHVLRYKLDMLLLTFARRRHAVVGVFGNKRTR